jgi:hypothetical protein
MRRQGLDERRQEKAHIRAGKRRRTLNTCGSQRPLARMDARSGARKKTASHPDIRESLFV